MTSASVFPAAEDLADARRNERRLDALVTASSDFVWMTDASGRLLSDMPGWRHIAPSINASSGTKTLANWAEGAEALPAKPAAARAS